MDLEISCRNRYSLVPRALRSCAAGLLGGANNWASPHTLRLAGARPFLDVRASKPKKQRCWCGRIYQEVGRSLRSARRIRRLIQHVLQSWPVQGSTPHRPCPQDFLTSLNMMRALCNPASHFNGCGQFLRDLRIPRLPVFP